MKRNVILAAACLLVLGYIIINRQTHSGFDQNRDVYTVRSDDEEMNAAIRTAKETLAAFRKTAEESKDIDISVKVPISENGEVEHFWLENTLLTKEGFAGKIGNDAELVHSVKYGDPITVKNDQITDWMYMKNGKMYGNYTLRVEIKHMPKETADKIRKQFQLDY